MFFIFSTTTTKKYKIKCREGSRKNLSGEFFLKIYRNLNFFLVKLIGQCTPDGDGRGIARDIKKYIFIFKTRQKMVTKFGQFKKLKCREESQLCYQFLSSFENLNDFC